jgi:hypothetical protein
LTLTISADVADIARPLLLRDVDHEGQQQQQHRHHQQHPPARQ